MTNRAFLAFDDFFEPLNKFLHPGSLFGMHHEKSFIKCHSSYTPHDNFLFSIINIGPWRLQSAYCARLYCSIARRPPSRSKDITASDARETTSLTCSISSNVNCSNTKSTGSIPSGGRPMPIRTL